SSSRINLRVPLMVEVVELFLPPLEGEDEEIDDGVAIATPYWALPIAPVPSSSSSDIRLRRGGLYVASRRTPTPRPAAWTNMWSSPSICATGGWCGGREVRALGRGWIPSPMLWIRSVLPFSMGWRRWSQIISRWGWGWGCGSGVPGPPLSHCHHYRRRRRILGWAVDVASDPRCGGNSGKGAAALCQREGDERWKKHLSSSEDCRLRWMSPWRSQTRAAAPSVAALLFGVDSQVFWEKGAILRYHGGGRWFSWFFQAAPSVAALLFGVDSEVFWEKRSILRLFFFQAAPFCRREAAEGGRAAQRRRRGQQWTVFHGRGRSLAGAVVLGSNLVDGVKALQDLLCVWPLGAFFDMAPPDEFLDVAPPDDESLHDWIEKAKAEGAVPLLEPENCANGWASPPGDKFMVRGPDYLSSTVKIPGGEFLLRPLGFDWLKCSSKISEILNHPNGRIRRALDHELQNGHKPFVWAFNLQVPSKDNYGAIAYFVATDPIQEGSLMDQFLRGDDAFRNSRLKLIANIVQGPWIVRTAVGEQAICILGRAVSCKYILGENFIEIDIDIGASMVASAIVHLAFGYISTLTVDLAFLIESQTELELPEKILGAVRFSELNPESACLYELPSEEHIRNMQSSFPSRLWRSIGQGFSHLLHQGSQDSSMPVPENVNGNGPEVDDNEEDSDFEDCKEDPEQ
ncbi:hypothetical protein Taro_000860, partial [Colocasia esculenta]|nr:hypothetical protein [Colocasia esculenta]